MAIPAVLLLTALHTWAMNLSDSSNRVGVFSSIVIPLSKVCPPHKLFMYVCSDSEMLFYSRFAFIITANGACLYSCLLLQYFLLNVTACTTA